MSKRRGRPPHADLLTPAEWRVLHATRHGLSNQRIADGMGVSINAIKYHIRNILEKTRLPNKKALRLYAQQPKQYKKAGFNYEEDSMANSKTTPAIGQISRTVSDIDVSRNWFELVLELPHLYTFGKMTFFDCNGTRLMLNQNEAFNPNESILYFQVNDIDTTYENLVQKDVEFIAAPHQIHQHDDGTQEWMAFFKDPDGRPLALMSQIRLP